MPYPYSKYNDGADAEVHVHDFLTTWKVNHVAEEENYKIVEFELLLDGPSTNLYNQNGLRVFESYDSTVKYQIHSIISLAESIEGSN